MFINKKIFAACLLAFNAIAATAQSLKVVDVTDSVVDEVLDSVSTDDVITLKPGVFYNIASAEESGYLYVQCPTKSSKKATISYIGVSFDDDYNIDVYDRSKQGSIPFTSASLRG